MGRKISIKQNKKLKFDESSVEDVTFIPYLKLLFLQAYQLWLGSQAGTFLKLITNIRLSNNYF